MKESERTERPGVTLRQSAYEKMGMIACETRHEKRFGESFRSREFAEILKSLKEPSSFAWRSDYGSYGLCEEPRMRSVFEKKTRVGAVFRAGVEPKTLKGRIFPAELLRNAERETRLRIKDCMGPYYFEDEFLNKNFMKIKETIIDLAWLAIRYNIGMADFYDFLTPVRMLNEAVYRIDDVVESVISNNHFGADNALNAMSKYGLNIFECSMLHFAQKFLREIGRPDLENTVFGIILPIRANALREAFAFSSEKDKKLAGFIFTDFIEPSDNTYGDIGFYNELFVKMFRKQINREKNKLMLLWNARCRATDVADHALDEREDVAKRIPSIMTLYAYERGKYSEKTVIENTIRNGDWNEEFKSIVDSYALELLKRIKEYIDGIEPRYRRVKALKQRTYRIIDLTQAMIIDPTAAKDYEAFYAKPLD